MIRVESRSSFAGPAGIREFNRLLQITNDEGLLARLNHMERQYRLTCPECGATAREQMPTDACQFFYECEGCHAVLRPLPGDCCVFCSFGSVPCPP